MGLKEKNNNNNNNASIWLYSLHQQLTSQLTDMQ